MQTAVEPFFTLPARTTPKWESADTVYASSKEIITKVASGLLPIGKFPAELITETERRRIVAALAGLSIRQYDNTDESEKVQVLGNPFVDSPSVLAYVTNPLNPVFEAVTQPLLQKIISFFSTFGFDVRRLTDPLTQLSYPAKVVRQIQVPANCYKEDGNHCTVLHCDDLLRDGSKKEDFVVPEELAGRNYHQFSVCLQLEDGGYQPDNLYVYEKQYSRELEKYFYGPGNWRFPAAQLNGAREHFYTPELRQAYFFCTQNFHDVRGGHHLARRINFSVFFIWIPDTNRLYYYN
jgi:hypothetical protein